MIGSVSHPRRHAITSTRDHTGGNWKVVYTDGSGEVQELALGSDGQVLTSNGASSAPSFEAPSGGGGGITWNEVTGTSQSAAVDNGYIANNAGLVTVTLPSTAALGSVVRVAGKGAGGWRVAQNSGQSIRFGNTVTTTGAGGRLDSNNDFDAVEILCTTANSGWTVISSVGNIEVT